MKHDDSKNLVKAQSLAAKGETFVCHILESKGYVIASKNFRRIGCELDIVAKKGEELVIIEVKTRTRNYWEVNPEHLLSIKKKKSLFRGILTYIAETRIEYNSIRIDLAIALYHTENDTFSLKYYKDIELPE